MPKRIRDDDDDMKDNLENKRIKIDKKMFKKIFNYLSNNYYNKI